MNHAVHRNTEQDADHQRQQKTDTRPEPTARLLTDGKESRCAGEMVQGEQDRAECRHPCPTVCREDGTGLRHAVGFYQHSASAIDHQEDRQNDLIGRNAQEECRQNDPRQPHERAERFQKEG